jgi:hypothetical protein
MHAHKNKIDTHIFFTLLRHFGLSSENVCASINEMRRVPVMNHVNGRKVG